MNPSCLTRPGVDRLVPDGRALSDALARTTHLGIGAHQDDLELGMIHGPLDCFARHDRWFTGVTCTNGSGSARTGVYADTTDEAMMAIRRDEQRAAAYTGRYSAMLQLGYPSREIKDPAHGALEQDLFEILQACAPEVVYTHNPADKHATHVAVFAAVLRALRRLPDGQRPARVLGCETWRGLDWMPDHRKVVLPLDGHESLQAALAGVFDSQIAGGKRYDTAAAGRYRANATFFESHAVDTATACVYAMDLSPLVADPGLAPADYVAGFLDETAAAIREQINHMMG